MDHLQLPLHLSQPILHVPYFCEGLVYTPPFLTFPERSNWTWDEMTNPFESSRSQESLDTFLQLWLFFGLLKTVFGPYFHPNQFICRINDGDISVITTKELPALWKKFSSESSKLSGEDLMHHRHTAVQNIHMAKQVLTVQLNNRRSHIQPSQKPIQTLVTLSIQFLIRFLAMRLRLQDMFTMNYGLHYGLIQSKMAEEGWCPFAITKMSNELGPENMYFIRHLEPPEAVHRHDKCSASKCQANDIVPETYVTSHIGHENCSFVAAHQSLMFDLLKTGDLPLVMNKQYESGNNIAIIPSSQTSRYVAISHVWSHGLGNNVENSLPICQLDRLGNAVQALYPSSQEAVAYWVDTISCPLRPDEATSLAIINMRRTYLEADKVLVIDASTSLYNAHDMSDAEKLLRILISSWTSRLWTLQEGILAKELFYQFADGAIDVDQTLNNLIDSDNYDEYTDVWFSFFALRGAWKRGEIKSGVQLPYLLNRAGRYRSTSVASDETLCYGTLAGLDMESIVSVPERDRMRMFWKMLPDLNHLVVFWTGRRLETPGFRWAPATLLHQPQEAFDLILDDFESGRGKPDAVIVEGGLKFQASGLLLGPWTSPIDSLFFAVDEMDRWLFVDVRLTQSVSGSKSITEIIEPQCSPSQNEDLSLALIFAPQNMIAEAIPPNLASTTRNRMALLIAVSGQEVSQTSTSSSIQGRILRSVLVVSIKHNNLEDDPTFIAVRDLATHGRINRQEVVISDSQKGFQLMPPSDDMCYHASNASRFFAADSEKELECYLDTGGRVSYRVHGNHILFDANSTNADQVWIVD